MRKAIKLKVYGILIITGIALSIWFVGYSCSLYQKRLATEESIRQAGSFSAGGVCDQNTIEFHGITYERNPSVKSILFMGVDTSGEMTRKVSGDGGQADAVFLIAHDTARGTVKILMIPRDTMTPVILTDLSGNVLGKDTQHITLAYAYGDGRELSCERMSEAVSELLGGLPIDGYLAMNTSMISEFNDLVGGVTVTVDVDGLEKKDPALKKGSTVTLQGKQAEVFVRFRDINIDHSAITRMSQQKQYIGAYLETVKKQVAKDDQIIVRIMDKVDKDMITNMSKPRYMEIGMAVLNSKQAFSQEDMLVIPGDAVTTELFDEYHHDPEGTQRMVLDLFYREK